MFYIKAIATQLIDNSAHPEIAESILKSSGVELLDEAHI